MMQPPWRTPKAPCAPRKKSPIDKDRSAAVTARTLADGVEGCALELQDSGKTRVRRLPLVRRLHTAERAFSGQAAAPADPERVSKEPKEWRALVARSLQLVAELRSYANELDGGQECADRRRALARKIGTIEAAFRNDSPSLEVRGFLLECVYSARDDLPLVRSLCDESVDFESFFDRTPGGPINAMKFVDRRFGAVYPEYENRLKCGPLEHALRVFLRSRKGRPPKGATQGRRYDAFTALLNASGMVDAARGLSDESLRIELQRRQPHFRRRSEEFRREATRIATKLKGRADARSLHSETLLRALLNTE